MRESVSDELTPTPRSPMTARRTPGAPAAGSMVARAGAVKPLASSPTENQKAAPGATPETSAEQSSGLVARDVTLRQSTPSVYE